MPRILIGTVLIIIGLSAIISFSVVKLVFALIIIFIGLRIISGHGRWDSDYWHEKSESSQDWLNDVAIFSPLNKTVNSENFKGGKVTLVFSGGEIDLSNVKTPAREVNMEVTAIFGGGKLIVPSGWSVNPNVAAIFGGFNNRTRAGGEITLNLKGAAIFGGLEIVNSRADN